MTVATIDQLQRFGPTRCESMSLQEARAWCRSLARNHYENFSVLSPFVPRKRDDFAAAYAFCRWADDLGDEVESPERALELLAWWRSQLRKCFSGQPEHPVFVALLPTIQAYNLTEPLLDDLIRAFEQDQTVNRYQTWGQVIDYCRLSANPVGRLVLKLTESPETADALAASDAICTALQLTNHWQDVQRDLLERNRVYLPAEMNPIHDFEERLRQSAARGYAIDRTFLGESRSVIKACVERTWPLFERGEALLELLEPRTRPIVWLFVAGGASVLRAIEHWNYETVLHRPTLTGGAKATLLARAWLSLQCARIVGGKRA